MHRLLIFILVVINLACTSANPIISRYLAAIGMLKYEHLFLEKEIDKSILLSPYLTTCDLIDIGVNNVKDRQDMMKSLEILRSMNSSDTFHYNTIKEKHYKEHCASIIDELIKQRGISLNDFQGTFSDYLIYAQNWAFNQVPLLLKQAREMFNVISKNGIEFSDSRNASNVTALGNIFITAPHKLKHDYEQLEYLISLNLIPFTEETMQLLSSIKAMYLKMSNTVAVEEYYLLSSEEYIDIGVFYNRNFYIHPIPRVKHALNPALDYEALQNSYLQGYPELLTYDNFLSVEARDSLLEFCSRSTIFYDVKVGYLGAYKDRGFVGDLIIQIAEELKQRFPLIFLDHKLEQAWAYKYDNELSGIKLHADSAAVNVNFWLSPDEANLDPASGGLVVYTIEAPMTWNFDEYNLRDREPDILRFLEENEAEKIVIPHAQNRMVMFNSNLFHASDHKGLFDPSHYKYRRLNLTFLFGHRQPSKNEKSWAKKGEEEYKMKQEL